MPTTHNKYGKRHHTGKVEDEEKKPEAGGAWEQRHSKESGYPFYLAQVRKQLELGHANGISVNVNLGLGIQLMRHWVKVWGRFVIEVLCKRRKKLDK